AKPACQWMAVHAVSCRERHVQLRLDPATDRSIAQVARHEGVHGHGKRGALEGPLDVGVVYMPRDLGQSGRFVKVAVAVDHGHVEEPATLRLFSGVGEKGEAAVRYHFGLGHAVHRCPLAGPHTSNIAAISKLVTWQARSISAAVTTTWSVVASPGANGCCAPECQPSAYARIRAANKRLCVSADSKPS